MEPASMPVRVGWRASAGAKGGIIASKAKDMAAITALFALLPIFLPLPQLSPTWVGKQPHTHSFPASYDHTEFATLSPVILDMISGLGFLIPSKIAPCWQVSPIQVLGRWQISCLLPDIASLGCKTGVVLRI